MQIKMKTLLLSIAAFGCLSFSFNDYEKKTYWLASCAVVAPTADVSIAVIVEAKDQQSAKKIFEKWALGFKNTKGGVIDKNTYTCHLVTPESIIK